MAEETQGSNLEQQIAFLLLLAKRPLLCPPVFARMCGSITAGMFLRQCLYWTGKSEEADGWFYKDIPKFQKELCMGEKEFRTARGIVTAKGFLETERRGAPPVVFFRVRLETVAKATQDQIRIDRETDSAERAKSIMAKGQNQLRRKGSSIMAKGQKRDYGEKAETLLAETTREKEPETTGAHPRRNGRPSASVLIIAQRQLMEAIDRRQPARGAFIENPDREEFERVQLSAADAGLTATQAKEFLGTLPGWRDKKWLDHLDSQQPLDFGPEKPAPTLDLRQPPPMEPATRQWEYIRGFLQHRTSPLSFDTWVKPLQSSGILDGVLYVRVPTTEFKGVGEKFDRELREALAAQKLKSASFLTWEELLNLNQEKTTA